METIRVPKSVSIFNDALSVLQANEADLSLGKVTPEEVLHETYVQSIEKKAAHERAQTVALAMIGLGIISVTPKAGPAPGAATAQRRHLTYAVDTAREAFAAEDLTNDRIKAAKMIGRKRHSEAAQAPIAVTKSALDDKISRTKGKINEENCGIIAAETRNRSRDEEIAKLQARIDKLRAQQANDDELIRKRKANRAQHIKELDALKAQRNK